MSKEDESDEAHARSRRPKGLSPTIEIPPDGDDHVAVAANSLEAKVGYGSLLRYTLALLRADQLPQTILRRTANNHAASCSRDSPSGQRSCPAGGQRHINSRRYGIRAPCFYFCQAAGPVSRRVNQHADLGRSNG